jgi:hypothetical protein
MQTLSLSLSLSLSFSLSLSLSHKYTAAIHAIVSAADLSTTTKSSIREALQAKYPKVDLLARKELIQSEITAAVAARAQ